MDIESDNNQKNLIEQAVQKFLDNHLQGQKLDIDEFVKQYPGLEEKIKQRIKSLHKIDGLFASLLKSDESDFNDSIPQHNLIGQKLGDFQILRLIGQGGMGAVFLARQVSLDREVALKVISDISGAHKKSIERFRREAKVLAKISHPNIVPIYEIGEQGPYAYFAMEYVSGVSLDKILSSIKQSQPSEKASVVMKKCLEAKSVIYDKEQSGPGAEIDTDYIVNISRVIIDIASALEHAHKNGVLHRDIKPSNILITSDGVSKLVDFGLAKAETEQTITISGEFFGTPSYVAPEQIQNPEVVDCRADVYSLAATFYECLTLHAPFEGNTVNKTLVDVISKPPVAPKKYCPRLSADFNTVLLHALEKSPDDRYSTASDFSADIENLLEFKPIKAKRPSITTRAYKTLRRNPLKVVVVVISILVILLGYFLFSNYTQKRNKATARKLEAIAARYFVSGDYTEALKYYKKAIAQYPFNAETYSVMGTTYQQLKQYPQAIEAYKQAIAIEPYYTVAINSIGNIYYSEGRYEEAIEMYQDIIKIRPNDAQAYCDLGNVLIILKRYQDGIAALKNAIRIDPNDARGYTTLGFACCSLGRYEEAIQVCQQAIKIDPKYSLAYNNLGSAYSDSGQYAKALEILKTGIKIEPNNELLLFNLGLAYSKLDCYAEAAEAYRESLRIKPNNAVALSNLGFVLERLGFQKESAEAYNQVITIDPNNFQAYLGLGGIYNDSGRYKEAVEAYKQATEIEPNDAGTYVLLGLNYSELKFYEDAVTAYKHAIKIKPDYAGAYLELGNAYNDMEHYEEAIEAYKQAATIDPNYVRAYENLGFVYVKLGRNAEAIQALKDFIRIAPDDANAYCYLGFTYHTLGRYEEAMEFYKQAIAIDPNSARAYNYLGLTAFNLGSYNEAIKNYKHAIKIDPNFALAHFNLGLAYHVLKRYDEAIASHKQACKLTDYKDHFPIAALASAYAESGDFEKAIEYQQKAIELADEKDKIEYKKHLATYESHKPWRE